MSGRIKLGAQALAVGAVVGLLTLLVWKIAHQGGGGAASALAHGKRPPAPNFALPRLDRPGTLELASLREKAVVVVNFWASWCIPCKKEAPRLQAASERWAKEGVVVVGVDAQDFSGDARGFMRRYGITYPVVHDGSGKTLGPYGVTGFPETFFVTRAGLLVGERVQGAVTDEQLERNIRLALGP